VLGVASGSVGRQLELRGSISPKERDLEIIEVPSAEKDKAEPTTDDRLLIGRRGPAAAYVGLK
jgi:hypothetical protein